ncbi:MAG TPA: pseudouridine synthase, partial [Nocardioidaceae bacterium]|nr:pseudouridine synthase [Nocardioidaceae bacterium]
IVALLTDISRSDAATLVADGGASIDGAVATSGKVRVTIGQIVEIDTERIPRRQLPVADPSIVVPVVFADDDVIVVDKPAGLVVHPGHGHPDGTLVNAVLAIYPDVATVGDVMRPGIVHRLDVGTSGLMVVARSQVAYDTLVAALAAREVVGEVLAVDLRPGPVSGQQRQGQAPVFEDEKGLVAVGRQLDLDDGLGRLAGPRVIVTHRDQQLPWRVARVHAARAFQCVGNPEVELAAGPEVALYRPVPAGETLRIGECRPQVVDVGVVAVLHAHDALPVLFSQSPQDAGASGRVARHLALLRSRFPRATSVCSASSRCSHRARYPPSHSSTSASRSGRTS